MSDPETEQGVPAEHHDAEAAAAEPSGGPDDAAVTEGADSPTDPEGPPEVDAEAAHAKFLETYQPVITRLPQALADERADETAAQEAAAAAQAQSERDEVEQRKAQLEAQQEREADAEAFKAEHYPGT